MSDWGTCRFCGKTAHQSRMVKYGVRHYAHPECYLDRHDISLLMPWQIRQLPWSILKERGLAERAEALIQVERA